MRVRVGLLTIGALLAACTLGCESVGPRVYRVPTGAMEPTIKRGQFIVVIRWAAGAIDVKRGDIVVFRAPGEPGKLWIKRAIAIAGDMIELRDRWLFLDGKHADEPHAVWAAPHGLLSDLEDFGPLRVPEGQIFVMGDNRYNSKDSRSFVPIPLKSVVGWVLF